MKVGVLGGGSWGTTVAALVSHNADTVLWARQLETVNEINQHHRNSKYLPDAQLPPQLKACHDLEETVKNIDVLVMGVPSHSYREVLQNVKPYLREWVPVISLTKGLERGTHKRMTELIEEELPGHPAGVLTGPNLAREIIAGQAAASVIAMNDPVIVKKLQSLFASGLFRVYTNQDVVGCELGGVLKNIIAIAVGMSDSQGAGVNTRSAMITRGLAEITRLGVAMGGEASTFAGLTGMGDLMATCTSEQSRNRHVGLELGKGRKIDDIINDMSMVAEGVKSAPTVMELANQHGIIMPIASDVYQVLTNEISARHALRGLIPAGSEADPA